MQLTQLSLRLWDFEDMSSQNAETEVVRCRRCHRKLKNPKYAELGYGSTCYKKHLAEIKKYKRLFEMKEGQK